MRSSSRPTFRAALFLTLASVGGAQGASRAEVERAPSGSVVRVGVVEDGPARGGALAEALRRELALAASDLTFVFPGELQRAGRWTAASVERELDRVLGADADLVFVLGPIGSDRVARRSGLPVPTLALGVLDAVLQDLPFESPGSGVPNLAYLSANVDVERRLAAFRELIELRRIAFLVPAWAEAALPALVERVAGELARRAEVVTVSVGASVDEALAALPDGLDGVCALPLVHLDDEAFERLAAGLARRGLASFALVGADDVRRGLLAGFGPGIDGDAVVERGVALALRVLDGEDAARLPTSVSDRDRLTISEPAARRLGVRPRFDVLVEADLVGPPVRAEDVLTLAAAMREALEVNPNLRAGELVVRSAWEDIAQARSSLRPQLDVGLSWTVIDESSANIGRAERSYAGSVSGSQLLWSEPVWANLDIQELVGESRAFEYEALLLDTARDAAVAYLDVLRARTLEEIRRSDLELTRSNYDLARERQRVGVGVPAEVYRWESRIATSRRAVVDARADVRLAEVELNRTLHRPLEQPVPTADVELDDPALLVGDRLAALLDDPWSFRRFRDHEIELGLARSPELAQLDAAIRAQERAFVSARRAHWHPTVGIDGRLTDVFDADGEGSQPVGTFFGVTFPPPEGTTWNAALVGSFSLYTGGAKRSRERQARHELIRLRYERSATADRVEQRILAAAHRAGASFTGIRLSRDAADAARRNLELVTDSYARGVVSIIELLDAQNAALVADASAASAVHDFARDLLEVQRATGRFTALDTPAAHAAWLDALEAGK